MKTNTIRSIIHSGRKSMMSFGLISFSQYIRNIFEGLRHPAGSGQREYAKQQLMRAWAPVVAVAFHALIVLCFVLMPESKTTVIQDTGSIQIPIKSPIEELLPTPEPPTPEPVDPSASSTVEPNAGDVLGGEYLTPVENPTPGSGGSVGPATAEPAGIEVAETATLSPAIMNWRPGKIGGGNTRNEGNIRGIVKREKLDSRGIEAAVMRSLRWLKSTQKADGSWDSPPVAMTSLALLCFLAHGETPASDEFGSCVERGMKYLADNQGSWPKRYEWAMATYAMSEAYGMTRIPSLKTVAANGVDVLVRGQRPSGGWCYGLTPQDEADDTSVMGWCAQALQAARLAKVEHDGLNSSIKLAVKAFKANAAPSGGFGYRGPGEGGLTGTGVLCMQLMGASKESEVRTGVAWLDRATFKWNDAWLGAPLYYWYYVTQAKYHAGGETWKAWDRQFSGELVRNQVRVKGEGNVELGFWELPMSGGKAVKDHSTGLVYNTTLCCLMLEVYYKFLPTYKPQEEVVEFKDDEEDTLKIDISLRSTQAVSA